MAKSSKKQVLGRGLSALLKDPENDIQSVFDKNANKIVGNTLEVEIGLIERNTYQPRTNFKQEELKELEDSIAELGVIQPITIRKTRFGKYELISGERRWRACKALKMNTIPAYVRIANDQEALEMALVENIQRQDLDAIEIALSYQQLVDEIQLTQEEISRRVGKKRSTITNYLRLLRLDPIVQTGIRDNFLSMGHGRALVNIEDTQKQIDIYQKIISHGMSVRETEELVKDYQEGYGEHIKKTKPSAPIIPEYISQGQQVIAEKLDNKVAVKMSNTKKGKLTISFDSKEEFEQLVHRFQ